MAEVDRGGALHLLAWLSPAFPVGGFAYSHGLEAAVDSEDVRDAATLTAWIVDLMEHGSIRNDAIVAAEAWRATTASDAAALREANDLALAFSTARERRLETSAMGTAFMGAIRAAWPEAASSLLPEGEIAYPVAFATAAATRNIDLRQCLEAFCLAFSQNLISAAVRLGPVGQTDGQRVTAALVPHALALASEAAKSTLDDLGGCALRSDIAAMRHEILYSRLFRS